MPYMNEKFVVALAIWTIRMDILSSLVTLMFFEMVELYCLDRVICQIGYRQHIRVDIDTSNVLHAITC